jgi:hypothetical protein
MFLEVNEMWGCEFWWSVPWKNGFFNNLPCRYDSHIFYPSEQHHPIAYLYVHLDILATYSIRFHLFRI